MDTQYISAVTALGAVILTPLIAFFTVHTQTKVSVLSMNRQKWIDNLRDVISEYCGLMNSLNQARSLGHQTYDDIYPKMQNAFELESKIMLLLNPNEEKHHKMTELITLGRVSVFGTNEEYCPEKWNEVWYQLMRTSKEILKEEWQRVKKLK
jgi:hypothetical protein